MNRITTADSRITTAIQSYRSSVFGSAMALASQLGNGPVLAGLMAILAVYLRWQHSRSLALACVYSGLLMLGYNGIKVVFRRKRPDTPYAATLRSSSFPSGHAASSMTAYGLIAYVLATEVVLPYGLIAGILVGLLPLAVGTSRVYLGAHHPSDVVAGWFLGLGGLVLLLVRFG